MKRINENIVSFFEKLKHLEDITYQKHFANIYVYAFLNKQNLIDVYLFNSAYSSNFDDSIKIKNQVLKNEEPDKVYESFLKTLINSKIEDFFIVEDINTHDLSKIIAITTKKFTISNALSTAEIKSNIVHLTGGHESLAAMNFIYESSCLSEKENRALQIMRNQNAINYPLNKYSAPLIIQKQQMDYQEIYKSLDQDNIRALKKFD